MTSLIHFERARVELEKASTVDEAKGIRDKAEAARNYAKQVGLSLELQNRCCELKLRAERKLGELLAKTPRQKPGDYKRSHRATVYPTLEELGVTKSQSSRWQSLAKLPKRKFEGHIHSILDGGRELTSASALKLAKQHQAQKPKPAPKKGEGWKTTHSLEALIDGGERFGCILADPPWPYDNQGTRAATKGHYKAMSLEQIKALPVAELAAKKSHLHLWTTNAFLFEAKEVLDAWGFEYRSAFVWVKPQMGLGNYWRVSHEYLLLGVRGGAGFLDKSKKSWIEEPRGKHSAKPESVRRMLEDVSPGPRLEMFARKATKGWMSWGNQVEGA